MTLTLTVVQTVFSPFFGAHTALSGRTMDGRAASTLERILGGAEAITGLATAAIPIAAAFSKIGRAARALRAQAVVDHRIALTTLEDCCTRPRFTMTPAGAARVRLALSALLRRPPGRKAAVGAPLKDAAAARRDLLDMHERKVLPDESDVSMAHRSTELFEGQVTAEFCDPKGAALWRGSNVIKLLASYKPVRLGAGLHERLRTLHEKTDDLAQGLEKKIATQTEELHRAESALATASEELLEVTADWESVRPNGPAFSRCGGSAARSRG